MAKKKSPKNVNDTVKPSKPKPKTSYLYQRFHKSVSQAVAPFIGSIVFNHKPSSHAAIREYQTHVMGHFTCVNEQCEAKGWGSKKIPIVIHKYSGSKYDAVVYNQRCKKCNQLGSMFVDKESYVDRVAYRLKKWEGVQMDEPFYKKRKGKPHEHKFCEGCRLGVCGEESD